MAAATVNMGELAPGRMGLRPRDAHGWGPGVMLALAAHLLLLGALALGVRWKSHEPAPVEAEVWSEVPEAVQAPVVPPRPVEAPQARPDKAEEPEPAPEPEPPRPLPIPDLVISKKPDKKEPKKQVKKAPVEVFEMTPPKVARQVDKPRDKKPEKDAAPPKATPKVPPAKVLPPVAKDAGPDAIEQAVAQREAQRKANLQRMMSDLGSLGTSSRAAGPSAAYGGRIKARIKPNIVFTESVSGNPLAVVEVRCGADGRIVSRKLLESSGLPTWDEAVLRAIDRTEVLPADESGRVPPVMQIEFRPKDF